MRRRYKLRCNFGHAGGPFDVRDVYVMLTVPLPTRCKIGISTHTHLRKTQVARRVVVVFRARVWGAERVEGVLHFLFRPFHAPVRGDGGSEFFWSVPTAFVAPVFIAFVWAAQTAVVLWPIVLLLTFFWT